MLPGWRRARRRCRSINKREAVETISIRFEPAVLILQLTHLHDVASFQAVVLGSPGTNSVGVHAVAATHLDRGGTSIELTQDADDLLLGKALLHGRRLQGST